MRLAFKTLLLVPPKPKPNSFAHTPRTLLLQPPAKTLVLLRAAPTPSFRCSACAPMSTHLHVRDGIEPSPKEEEIFDRLRKTLSHFHLDTQLRVAGGWVRDKLLGKECKDIDIAIDNMMGTEFADKVREYSLSFGKEEDVKGVHVIERYLSPSACASV